MRDRYSIGVGLVFLALVVFVAIRTLGGGDGDETLGLDRLGARWPLPEFAVPDAAGSLEGDANVAQDDCGSRGIPCPEDPPRKPACRIETPGALRVCDYFDKPLVLSFWFSEGGGCVDQQDVVDRVYRRYGDRVSFLSLDVRDDRDTVRHLLAERGWQMPVGYDRDGAVAALYRVGGCPTFAYAYPGGTLYAAGVGELSTAQLEARVRELMAASVAAERPGAG